EDVSEGRNSLSTKSINNDSPMIDATPLSSIYPPPPSPNIVENIVYSDDPSFEGGAPRKALPPKKVPARASKVAGEASTPLDVDSDSNIHAKEFKDATDCHWVDLDKNPLVSDMRAEIKALQGQVDGLHGEYSRLILEERKWVNYEQTLSSLQAKIKDIESEREKLNSSKTQLLRERDSLK
nr:hypothetical protein [Tanacetum cinerariifolium]